MTAMQQTALAAFSSARALFLERRFDQARRRMREYRRLIDYRRFPMTEQRGVPYPACSVILVIHSAAADTLTSIDSLLAQLAGRAEIIVVDNGGSEALHDALASRPLLHVRCPYNFLPSESRNIGAFFARSPILVFMDDDGLPADDYIEQAIAALAPPEVIGVRGKIRPLTPDGLTGPHYDMGDQPTDNASFNLEGNMAIKRGVFRAVGGFDSLMFGNEGHELADRCRRAKPKGLIRYWPGLVLQHDFAHGGRLIAKRKRQAAGNAYIEYLKTEISSPTNGEVNVNQPGISLILRAGGNLKAAEATLNELASSPRYKPLEVFLLFKKVEAGHLQLTRKFAGLFRLVVLGSENHDLAGLAQKAHHEWILVATCPAKLTGAHLRDLAGQVSRIEKPADSLMDIEGVGQVVFARKDMLVGLRTVPAIAGKFGEATWASPQNADALASNLLRARGKGRIVAGMATIPERARTLKKVLERILPQVDCLYLYLNGYDKIPDDLVDNKVHVVTSREYGDLGARGKFFGLWYSSNDDYYFSLDDDFIYPRDYVSRMLEVIKKYNGAVATCVHGSIFGDPLEWYFERTKVYNSRGANDFDRFVNLAGTGTFACHLASFPLDFTDFFPNTMCDLQVSIKARRMGVPILAISRDKGWLEIIENDEAINSGVDYWSQMLKDDKGRTELAQQIDWTFRGCRPYLKKVINSVLDESIDMKSSKLGLDPEVIECLFDDNKIPVDWDSGRSRLFLVRKYQFKRQFAIANYQMSPEVEADAKFFANFPDPTTLSTSDLRKKIAELNKWG